MMQNSELSPVVAFMQWFVAFMQWLTLVVGIAIVIHILDEIKNLLHGTEEEVENAE